MQNIHERKISTSLMEVAVLLDSLASTSDRFWPHETWPPMKFNKPMQVGAKGGHGPIRYWVKSYQPGNSVYFEFTSPTGFNGYHGFELKSGDSGNTIIRHILEMKTTGTALLSWPMIFRPLHDALIEDSFDKVERNLEFTPKGSSWSVWVKFLRWMIRKIQTHNKSLHRMANRRR